MTAIDSPVLNLRAAGAYLNRGRTWMIGHADEIGVIRDGGPLRFLKEDLDAYLARHRTQKTDKAEPTPIRQARRTEKHTKISRLTGRPFRSPTPPVAARRLGGE